MQSNCNGGVSINKFILVIHCVVCSLHKTFLNVSVFLISFIYVSIDWAKQS